MSTAVASNAIVYRSLCIGSMHMNQRQIARTLLVDADDTLWETTIFYVRCTNRFPGLYGDPGF